MTILGALGPSGSGALVVVVGRRRREWRTGRRGSPRGGWSAREQLSVVAPRNTRTGPGAGERRQHLAARASEAAQGGFFAARPLGEGGMRRGAPPPPALPVAVDRAREACAEYGEEPPAQRGGRGHARGS